MTVRDVIREIDKRREALNRIEAARAQGFDLDVTVGSIDATKREIEELENLKVVDDTALPVKHIHEVYPEHDWERDENGNIKEFEMGDYHCGPMCKRCFEGFCIMCEPNGFETHKECVIDYDVCPKCGKSVLGGYGDYCSHCGQKVKW